MFLATPPQVFHPFEIITKESESSVHSDYCVSLIDEFFEICRDPAFLDDAETLFIVARIVWKTFVRSLPHWEDASHVQSLPQHMVYTVYVRC